jgi:hypothetical protein
LPALNFALKYAIRGVPANREGLKLNGTHQLFVYADVNILGGSIHTITKNTEALVVTSKKIRSEVNAEKTKYTIIIIIILLAFTTHLGDFSLLSLEVSRSHTRTHHSR